MKHTQMSHHYEKIHPPLTLEEQEAPKLSTSPTAFQALRCIGFYPKATTLNSKPSR